MVKITALYKWAKTAFNYRIHKNSNRDKTLWVFGCWGGIKYSDNSKYLFEYVRENYPMIKAVWITKNKNVYELLKSEKKDVYYADTYEGNQILKNAGVAFFTNSLNDFGDNHLLNGAKLCSLFHGVGFKNELRELDNPHSIKSKLKMLKHKIYDPSFTSLIFTTSEFFKNKFHIQQYNAPLDHIVLTGQPRNDLFFDKTIKKIGKKQILYMPTFREDESGQDKLRYIINEMANSNILQDLLEDYGYTLIIKPHFLTKVEKNKELLNILIYNDLDIPDIQMLLKDIDILITDYSSVIGDFVLLNRPIIFYSYDLEEYKRLKPMHNGYDDILDLTYVTNLNDLISLIRHIFNNQIDYASINEKINSYINDPELRNGGYSKNICDYMVSYLNIDLNQGESDDKSH